jgi:hypothetical protein
MSLEKSCSIKRLLSIHLPWMIFVGGLIGPVIINIINPTFGLLNCLKEFSISLWIITITVAWIRNKYYTEKNEEVIRVFSKRLDETKKLERVNLKEIREYSHILRNAETRSIKLERITASNENLLGVIGIMAATVGILVYFCN